VAELLKQTPPVVNEIALSKLLATKAEAAPAR
jgi:peptidylprolyl isomerase